MTLEIRKTFLPNDLQYALDCASEYCGITAAADIAIRLYGDAKIMDDIWEKPDTNAVLQPKYWHHGLHGRELATEHYGAYLIKQLPVARRIALVERGVLSICHDIKGKAEWMSSSRYEDQTKGGVFESFLNKWRLDRNMMPTPKTARRLRSVTVIRKYIRAEKEMQHIANLFRSLASIDVKGVCTEADRQAIFDDLNGQTDTHRIEARRAIEIADWQTTLVTDEPWQDDNVIVKLKPEFKKKALEEKKRLKRATKRAAMLAAALLGASSVSAFARGEVVMIPGTEVSLSAKMSRHVAASGHGSINVGIHDIAGERLASLCVFQEMPALDQLVSLAMHVQAGCVDDVLNTGNIFAVQPAGDSHPAILSRKKPGREVHIADMVDAMERPRWGRAMPDRDTRAMFEAGRDAYVAEMREFYEDTIADVVFGRAAKIWKARRLAAPKGWGDD